MKVTPLEIRQKSFERTLRGYDKDEVNAFLLSLSQEWERMNDEVKELRMKLNACESEVAKLREVETSLFRTLKTAEDTGANVVDQAKKTAELYVREAQISADAMLHEAKTRAKNTIEEADDLSKQMMGEMEDGLRELVQLYKSAESQRNNLIDDLTRIANETLDRAERVKKSTKSFNPDDHLNYAKREVKRTMYPNEVGSKRLHTQPEAQKPIISESEPMRSFFDEVA